MINKLTGAVEISHRFAEFTQQYVREAASSLAAVHDHFMKGDSFEFERRRDVFDDVVGATPVAPRLVEAVQVAGSHERTNDVRRVWVRRSLG